MLIWPRLYKTKTLFKARFRNLQVSKPFAIFLNQDWLLDTKILRKFAVNSEKVINNFFLTKIVDIFMVHINSDLELSLF